MLDVHRLRILRELERRGTLAAVAVALGYSPSAISQQLTQLEREAGTPLLDRVGRGVRLTPAAIQLVGHAEEVLARLELAQADLALAADHQAGVVRLAVFQSAAHVMLPKALSSLAVTAPMLVVRVDVVEAEVALPALVAGELDLVVAEEYPGQPLPRGQGVHRQSLVEDQLVLARHHDVPGGLPELAEAPWVLEPPGIRSRAWAESVCRTAGFEPQVRYQSIDLSLHLQLVRDNHAVAFLPRLAVPDSTGIRLTGLPGADRRSIYTAVRSGTQRHPHVQAVRAALAA